MGGTKTCIKLTWTVPRHFLYPLFVADLEARFADSPFDYVVVDGYRTLEEQGARWIRARKGDGPPAQAPGKSPHNYGCAAHLVPVEQAEAETWDFSSLSWGWIAHHVPAKPHGEGRLLHGRSWRKWQHIEWRGWERWQRVVT